MISSRIRKQQIPHWNLYAKIFLNIVFFTIFVSTLFFLVSQFKMYFPIKSVKIYGVQNADQQDVQQILTPLVDKGFFAIQVESIKERLLQSPWVSKAVVQRVWPDKVVITVTEKQPLARWNNKHLISLTGEIFTPDTSTFPKGLPQFLGEENQYMKILQCYQKLNLILQPLHFKIDRLELTPELTWVVILQNGVKLRVGYKDILTRISHFVKVYPKIIGSRFADVEYVDLRYTNGLAVKWKTVK